MNEKIVIGVAAIAVALALAAGIIDIAAGQNQQQQPAPPSNDTNKLRVIASFFPLYDFSRNVGGDRAEVSV
ncbi:MAG: ABC transporter substrate-binding protein, partial [Thermoproteota archaeon]|nr:ABC transporter substrate-binding protein [Thermoproteota archaeon]